MAEATAWRYILHPARYLTYGTIASPHPVTPIAVKERRRMHANALFSPTSLTPGFMVVHANRLEDLRGLAVEWSGCAGAAEGSKPFWCRAMVGSG